MSRILEIPGFDQEATLKMFGYALPLKSMDFVAIRCRGCNEIFERRAADTYRCKDTGFRCSKCFHKDRAVFMVGRKCKQDWKDRIGKVESFSTENTLRLFGYEYPTKGINRVAVVCACGEIGSSKASDIFLRYEKLSYKCHSCIAIEREENLRPDYKERLDKYIEFSKERTLEVFGYEYPDRAISKAVVLCRDCKEESEIAICDLFRKEEHRCEVCRGRHHFSIRKDNFFKGRDKYWSVDDNRERHAEIARNQPHRSENMKRLNQDENFQDLRTAGLKSSSKGEIELLDFVRSLGIDADKKFFTGQPRGYEIDVFVESLNYGFEFNGLYYHGNRGKNYHLNKMMFFKERGIKLIQVWEHEWYKREYQVRGRVKSLLNLNSRRLDARKCRIYTPTKDDALVFVNTYHIQKTDRGEFFLALGFEGEMVACAIFSKHHRNKNEMILKRFVAKEDVTIAGGLSRLTVNASRELKCDLFSWCDLRWSDGQGYEKSGWTKILTNRPDYFYTKNGRIISKQSRAKRIAKTPEGMTESEHAIKEGLAKVYDCGKIKYKFSYRR